MSELQRHWRRVERVFTLGSDGARIDPQERGAPISICRDQRSSWSAIWPALRHYG